LNGRETLIWLTITGKAPDGDFQAVQVVLSWFTVNWNRGGL